MTSSSRMYVGRNCKNHIRQSVTVADDRILTGAYDGQHSVKRYHNKLLQRAKLWLRMHDRWCCGIFAQSAATPPDRTSQRPQPHAPDRPAPLRPALLQPCDDGLRIPQTLVNCRMCAKCACDLARFAQNSQRTRPATACVAGAQQAVQ